MEGKDKLIKTKAENMYGLLGEDQYKNNETKSREYLRIVKEGTRRSIVGRLRGFKRPAQIFLIKENFYG